MLRGRRARRPDKLDNLTDLLENGPKPGQSAEQCVGYAVWARACWLRLRGAVPALDERLEELFRTAFFVIDGKAVPVVPRDAPESTYTQLLDQYLATC